MEKVSKTELRKLHKANKLGIINSLPNLAEPIALIMRNATKSQLDDLIPKQVHNLGNTTDYDDRYGYGVFTVFKLVLHTKTYYLLQSYEMRKGIPCSYENTIVYVLL